MDRKTEKWQIHTIRLFTFLAFLIFLKEYVICVRYAITTSTDNTLRRKGIRVKSKRLTSFGNYVNETQRQRQVKMISSSSDNSETVTRFQNNREQDPHITFLDKKSGNVTISDRPKLNNYQLFLIEREARRTSFLEVLKLQQIKRDEEEDETSKYVIFYPESAGLGNSIAVMAEAILLSFITNRRFYLYDFSSFNLYFDLPFKHFNFHDDSFMKDDNIVIANSCRMLESDIINSEKKFIVFRNTCKILDYIVFTEDYYDTLDKFGFIVNPKRRDGNEIRKSVYGFIYNNVISLKPFVVEEIEKIKINLNWGKYYIIGLQIRTGQIGHDYSDVFLLKDDIKYFESKAEEITKIMEGKKSKPVRWFISCDNDKQKEKFIASHATRAISSKCELSHTMIEQHSTVQSRGYLCSLIDSYLLSSTDYAIITARSTYGIWSVNRNISIPRIQVHKGEWKNKLRSSGIYS